MIKSGLFGAAALAALGGCATDGGSVNADARAELRDPAGRVVARSAVSESTAGVRVQIEAAGLGAGTYGAHVHAVGRCDAPDFASAGPHWNPTGHQHGSENPQGPHLGDLPNLVVGSNGAGSIEFVVPNATLRGVQGVLDADGAAVVVHASPDDYRTDPSGNSGARIACGVLG